MGNPISGHVFRVERRRGPQWYAKYRLPDGRQVQRRIGPAWTDRGRPATGFFTKRTAQAWLDEVLAQARRGELVGMVRTGATVADAITEWLRWAEHDRDCKPSTLADYRSTGRLIERELGHLRLEDVTPELLERWKTTIPGSNRNVQKRLVVLNGIFRRAMRVWRLPRNPVADVERPRVRISTDIDAFSPEEIHALVRAADSAPDATLFLTAAFTVLRLGELLALRWCDLDFARQAIRVRRSFTAHGGMSSPKSGRVRSVPLVSDVAQALAALGTRELFTDEDDLVFPGVTGDPQDGSSLRLRYKAALSRAGLRALRFHDYADLRVMPTSAMRADVLPAQNKLRGFCRSA
jgi:integrase